MAPSRLLLSLGVLALFLGAGCSAKEPPGTISMVDAGEGTGAIGGTVKDLAGSPVEKATLTLNRSASADAPKSTVLETGPEGAFKFQGLAPGAYTLDVAKAGYLPPPAQSLDVVQNGEKTLTLLLEKLPAPKPPSVKTDAHSLQMGSRACPVVLNSTKPCVGSGEAVNLSIQVDVNENASGLLQTLLIEASWPPQPSPCEGRVAFDVYSPQFTTYMPDGGKTPSRDPSTPPSPPKGNPEAFHWASDRDAGDSPMRLAISRLGTGPAAMHSNERIQANNGTPIQTSGLWTVRFQPLDGSDNPHVGISCRHDQTLSIHATRFYGDPMPTPDWTAAS